MFSFFGKKGVSYIASPAAQKEIDRWLESSKLKKGSFGVILEEMGFDLNEQVFLRLYKNDGSKTYLFYDNLDEKVMTLLDSNFIELEINGVKFTYDCIYNRNVDGKVYVEMMKSQRIKNEDGISYICDIEKINRRNIINIVMENKNLDQGIELKFSNKRYSTINFTLRNEKVLQDYFKSLKYSKNIEDIYCDICYILKDEIIKYNNVILNCYNPSTLKKNINSSLEYIFDDSYEKISVISDGIEKSYLRNYSNDKVDINVSYNDYRFYLEVYYGAGFSTRKLDNEKELMKYLVGLTFPISIVDVYKKICEISLGDVSKYSRIVIRCCNVKDNVKETDLIVLEDGNFGEFGITKNDKTIFIDKYGNYTYRMSDLTTDVEISISSDDRTKCEISTKDGNCMDEYIDSLLVVTDINDARYEKEETKKLVRTIFDKNGSN